MNKFLLSFILLFLITFQAFSQSEGYFERYKDYMEQHKNENGEHSHGENEFFKALNSKEKADAILEISHHVSDPNFIAYGLFGPNYKSIETDSVFRKHIFKHLVDENTPDGFKYVAFDFLDDLDYNVDEEKLFRDSVLEIALDENANKPIRKVAISNLGRYTDENTLSIIDNFLLEPDHKIASGAAMALKSILSNTEKSSYFTRFENTLLTSIRNQADSLTYAKSQMHCLGLMKSESGKELLLDLLEEKAQKGKSSVFPIITSLSYMMDVDTYTESFGQVLLNKDKFMDKYELNLRLKSFTKRNKEMISQIPLDNSRNKMVFAKSIELKRKDARDSEIQQLKNLLNDPDENVRLQAVIALHHQLPHEEEIEAFKKIKQTETSDIVKEKLYLYTGWN